MRSLAAQLRVSPATVASAYRCLRERGLIETAGRRGTRIRPRPPVAGPRSSMPPPPGGVDLASGEPDPALLPDLGPHLRRLATTVGHASGYASAGPCPELVALARERLAADQIPVSADALTVTAGALDAIERLLSVHLRPGDRVAVEDPGWGNLFDLVAALGMTPIGVPVDQEGPTPHGLRRALTAGARAVVVTTRAHNPTGAAVTQARAEALRAELRNYPDVLLVEDDHAAEIAGVPLHPLAGATTTWAFVRSVSKPYGPDLRLAVLAGDPATVARVEGRLRLGAGWVSTLLQQLVVSLWRDPHVAARIDAARERYAQRRTTLCEALVARGVAAHGRCGLNLWVPVADETTVVTTLRDAGYAVAPGSRYRLTAAPGIRITISRLDTSAVPAVAGAVATAVNRPRTLRTV